MPSLEGQQPLPGSWDREVGSDSAGSTSKLSSRSLEDRSQREVEAGPRAKSCQHGPAGRDRPSSGVRALVWHWWRLPRTSQ